MRGRSILLAFAGTLPSPTTADPIALAIVVPTESASLPLDGSKNSGLLDQQRPGVPTPRQVVSEGTGKETCGFFRAGRAGAGTSSIACHNTGRWLCGSLYSTCPGPADPICSGKTQNGERTLCCIIVVVFGFGYFLQAPDRVCETLRYPDGHDTPGIFDE
ncbi:hypothetical protein COL5a_001179 [Colletotrichum fioriniae]|nr:hypothetical protein COL5a_001179 [Colletotrichum fioriniae]